MEPKKVHVPEGAPITLQLLPEDILVRICSMVTNASLTDIRNLELVSTSLREAANNKFVVQNLPLHQLELVPSFWSQYPGRFNKFMKRCHKQGNPEAIYRKGLISYFHNNSETRQQEKGFLSMTKTAELGNEEARYVAGVIMLCLGGEYIKKGLHILSPLLKRPMLSTARSDLEALRVKFLGKMWWFPNKRRTHLLSLYKPADCKCDRKTKAQNNGWCRFGSDNDITVSSCCPVCVWDYEVKEFITG